MIPPAVRSDERIEQIEVNLDRLRWLPDDLGTRHVRVNIPAFELSVHDGDEIPLRMRVIVGSRENQTPVFSGKMEYLVFSPYWNIPSSIVTKEILPKMEENPNYLERQQIEIVRTNGDTYQLRQRPGAFNSLGLVKFIFPNRFDVYLHDTPADNLFDRLTRTLSHGCVRVEEPAELAAYVLQDQEDWTDEQIHAAMHSRREKRVDLLTALPVHILYWTAWVDRNRQVQFRNDVYGYDAKHRALMTRPPPASNTPNVDVNKVRARIIADATRLQG
jgi:murein L,D-transpeptidase YcbB/YkuD